VEFDLFHVINKSFDYFVFSLIFAFSLLALWLPKSFTISHSTFAKTLLFIAILTTLATASIDLLFRTAILADVAPMEAFSFIPKVLDKSDYGFLWQLRIALWGVVFTVALWLIKKPSQTKLPLIILIATTLSALLMSATGHAGENGVWTLANINNWLHLIGIAMWGGCVVLYALIVLPALIRDTLSEKIASVSTTLSSIATVALALVVITGIINSWRQLQSIEALFNTPYGEILLLKLTFVAIMMGIGTFNRFILVPKIEKQYRSSNKDLNTAHRFQRILRIDSLLFITILVAAAILGMQIPPAHM